MHTTLTGTTYSYTGFGYDARGHQINAYSTLPEMAGARTIQHTYDSADRVRTLTYPNGETLTYSYDAAWRAAWVCSSWGPCYVGNTGNAQYSALDQPTQQTLGSRLSVSWSYQPQTQRLAQVTVPGVLNRSYQYDAGGNVQQISDTLRGQTQQLRYDERDRLLHGWTTGSSSGGYDATMSYDSIGNLVSKLGMGYHYPASGTSSSQPHAVQSTDWWGNFSYDPNGNLTSGKGRTYTYNVNNQPVQITGPDGVAEVYRYDADGERDLRTRSGLTTVFLGGLYEEDLQTGTARLYYQFAGQVVAQRTVTNGTGPLVYLHGDQLGSVAAATDGSNGAVLSTQDYTPWGEVRVGGVSQTKRSFTGQQQDGTGLLFYHARYYDPALARFTSADSIVPGAASASGGGAATLGGGSTTPLTVDFHEPGFVSQHNAATGSMSF
ncbi:MAG: hypothetical protein H0X37_04440 [Herpetosiphonaceae bacterium]|nr:hypothetical protein [Herpetosiphonaceae bacterium]